MAKSTRSKRSYTPPGIPGRNYVVNPNRWRKNKPWESPIPLIGDLYPGGKSGLYGDGIELPATGSIMSQEDPEGAKILIGTGVAILGILAIGYFLANRKQ